MIKFDNLQLKINEDGSVAYASREQRLDIEVPANFFSEFISDYWVYNGTELELIPDAEELRDAAIAAELAEKEAAELAAAKQNSLNTADSVFDAEVATITTGYSLQEIDSWPTQESEALAYTASDTADTPLIDARLSVTLGDKAILVASILAKAEMYKVEFGKALGRKKKVQNDNI